MSAARSLLRSSVSRATAAASRTTSKSPRSVPRPISPRIFRSPVEMSSFCLESLLPHHTTTASALLTSMSAASRHTCGWNPEVFLVELRGRAYRCRFCDCPLALADDIVSRSFNCRQGRAYLFNNVVNVTLGAEEERLMLSGMHTVEDIYCCCCGQILGWKYVAAHDKNRKYKEGKFVLERWRIADEIAQDFNLDAQPGSSDAEA